MWTQFAANALMTGAAYALVACAFALVYRVLGYYYIVLGAMLAVAPVVVHWLAVDHSVVLLLAVLGGISASVVLALLDHQIIYRPMQARDSGSLSLFLASTAAYFLVTNSLLWIAGPEARAFSTASLGVLDVFGARVPVTGGFLVAGAVGVWLALLLWMQWSRAGLAMRLVADDEDLAAIMGIPVQRVRITTVIVAAIIAGLAGVLIGLNQSVRFNMGMPLLLKGILASVLGGVGNITFSFVAGLLVGVLEIVAVAALPSGLKDVVLFGCLAIVLVARPDGLMSGPVRRD